MVITLKSSVSEISGVGEKYQKKLEKLGIKTVEDLLLYLPKRWEDFTKITPIAEVRYASSFCVKGSIWSIGNKRSARRRMTITEAIVADSTGTIKCVWFNQPYIEKNLKVGDEVLVAGKAENNLGVFSFVSPAYEKVGAKGDDELNHLGRIVPIYGETEGLSSKWLRWQMRKLIKVIYSIKEYLPSEIIKHQNLISYPAAIRQMHFPDNQTKIDQALYRLNFDEIFLLQLAVQNERKKTEAESAVSIKFREDAIKKFIAKMGFELTNSQKKSAWEIFQDLEKPYPMNRLLEGDVGSGKTFVAAMATFMTAINGFQSALLVPTEILAKQHYEKLKVIFDDFEISVGLLIGKMKKIERDEVVNKVKNGDIQILIGTHAILNGSIDWYNLSLVVVDEQHRFGVDQRKKLREKSGDGKTPHFLSMSATPIPRTLAISVYGDLDLSVINELPPGRKKVGTYYIPTEKKEDSYEFIRQQVKKGRQVFVICPLIDDSETLEVKSVTKEYQRLNDIIFPEFKIDMLHGKMTSQTKEKIMEDFAGGKTNILVSTSLVEVGVDVPNATIMIIEGADRFGLAQLHQFRGRVGRGIYQSFCFLFSESESENSIKRLNAITRTNNGFDIAEKDLEIRGPGDVLGTRQHGLPDINMKNLMNVELVKKTREEATRFLKKYDLKEFPLLQEKTNRFKGITTLE